MCKINFFCFFLCVRMQQYPYKERCITVSAPVVNVVDLVYPEHLSYVLEYV
jgi:hypothetical protein